MRNFLFLFLLVILLTSSSSAFSDWIDKTLLPHLTFECSNFVTGSGIYSDAVENLELASWIELNVDYQCFEANRSFVTYPDSISVRDACHLLNVDPSEAVIIHNILLEIRRDPDFDGDVCSWSGVLNL